MDYVQTDALLSENALSGYIQSGLKKFFLNNVFFPKPAMPHMRSLLIIWLKSLFGWVHGKIFMSVEEI